MSGHTENPTGAHESTCRHCGERIVWDGSTFYPSWTHQPAGAAFRDGMYRSCKLTAAEPPASLSGVDDGKDER